MSLIANLKSKLKNAKWGIQNGGAKIFKNLKTPRFPSNLGIIWFSRSFITDMKSKLEN